MLSFKKKGGEKKTTKNGIFFFLLRALPSQLLPMLWQSCFPCLREPLLRGGMRRVPHSHERIRDPLSGHAHGRAGGDQEKKRPREGKRLPHVPRSLLPRSLHVEALERGMNVREEGERKASPLGAKKVMTREANAFVPHEAHSCKLSLLSRDGSTPSASVRPRPV